MSHYYFLNQYIYFNAAQNCHYITVLKPILKRLESLAIVSINKNFLS